MLILSYLFFMSQCLAEFLPAHFSLSWEEFLKLCLKQLQFTNEVPMKEVVSFVSMMRGEHRS